MMKRYLFWAALAAVGFLIFWILVVVPLKELWDERDR